MEPEVTFEKPREYTKENVVYWEPHSKELKVQKGGSSYLAKARAFLMGGCINQIAPAEWKCTPLNKYNKSTHLIRYTTEGWDCTCQGFNVKKIRFEKGESNDKPFCSHILAVKQFKFIEDNNNDF